MFPSMQDRKFLASTLSIMVAILRGDLSNLQLAIYVDCPSQIVNADPQG